MDSCRDLSAVAIGIAVVEHRGNYLVGLRGEAGPLAGCAEFPGGKCLPVESPRDCAVRECGEESGLRVEPLRELLVQPWDYPHGKVELHFWSCRLAETGLYAEPAYGFAWVPRAELDSLPFPPANRALIAGLAGNCTSRFES